MLNPRARRYLYANSRVITPLHKSSSIKALLRFLDEKKRTCTGIHAYSGHIISQIDDAYYLKYVKIPLYMSDGGLPDQRDIEARIDHINEFLTEIYDAPLNSGVQRIQLALAQLDEVLSQSHHLKPNA